MAREAADPVGRPGEFHRTSLVAKTTPYVELPSAHEIEMEKSWFPKMGRALHAFGCIYNDGSKSIRLCQGKSDSSLIHFYNEKSQTYIHLVCQECWTYHVYPSFHILETVPVGRIVDRYELNKPDNLCHDHGRFDLVDEQGCHTGCSPGDECPKLHLLSYRCGCPKLTVASDFYKKWLQLSSPNALKQVKQLHATLSFLVLPSDSDRFAWLCQLYHLAGFVSILEARSWELQAILEHLTCVTFPNFVRVAAFQCLIKLERVGLHTDSVTWEDIQMYGIERENECLKCDFAAWPLNSSMGDAVAFIGRSLRFGLIFRASLAYRSNQAKLEARDPSSSVLHPASLPSSSPETKDST